MKKLKNLFFLEQWNIGILNFPIAKILEKNPEISWLEDPSKATFHADPFGFEIDEKKFIIFEDYSQFLKRGRIAIAEFSEKKLCNKKIILDDKRHLSYPFVIHHENRILLVCEASKAKNLSLYEIDKKTLEAKKIREIFSNREAIDPTIFYHQNKFWIFYTKSDAPNSHLFISFSDSLFSSFQDHPRNPVKIDSSSARSAGTIFFHEGKIYRPAQNCSKNYGASIVINRVDELSEENFSEEKVLEIKPDEKSSYSQGLHTISSFGELTLVDGKRKIFLLAKPALSILRNLKKFLVN